MAQVKLKEEQELWESEEEQHSVIHEIKQEPEVREIQSSVLLCLKEEVEEVEIKSEPLPQFLQVTVKSEEVEPQSSLLHQTGTEENREDAASDGTDDSEDWTPSAAPQTQAEGNRKRSDSESSWEFEPPPAKTQVQTKPKRTMEDLTVSVCGRKYWPFPKKRPFKCPVCGKCFITRTHQKRHVSSHTGEYTWNCSLCGEVFRQEGHLRMHMKRHVANTHCSICGMPFSNASLLKSHMMRSHIVGEQHSCVVCDMKFPHLCALDRHMRTHAADGPFTCRLCAKQFEQIAALKTHMNVHSRKKFVKKSKVR